VRRLRCPTHKGGPRYATLAERGEALTLLSNDSGSDLDPGLWGLLWIACIKMTANGEQSCCRRIFELGP
jgi:hypothetical protein